LDLKKELKNDQEALILLSALGFLVRDWAFINKLGGARAFLASELLRPLLEKITVKDLANSLNNFLSLDGFIVTYISHPHLSLFKSVNSPLVFFGRFNQALLEQKPVISIVGSRKASAYGLLQAKNLSNLLAENNILVASGGAFGVDRAAHMACLQAKAGKTIAILGTACDLKELDSCAKLFLNHKDNTCIIYPFGPFLSQQKFMFVERNRYVALIADALVVVEGQEGSGTLHTAKYAKKHNITLYAIPGALDNPQSFAPNFLLEKNLAQALVNFKEFAGVYKPKTNRPVIEKPQKNNIELSGLLKIIKEHQNSLGFDELLLITGKNYADLQKELFEFELSGQITKRGAQFVLTGG
jgi:DNA processing protein